MVAKEPQLADATAQQEAQHPLDPLSAEEITAAVAILRAAGRLGPRARFVTVELQEPPKAAVLAYRPAAPPAREAFAIVLDRADGRAYEAVVDLTAKAVRSWTHRPGAQPYFVWEELTEATTAVRAHPAWQQALQRRGITDLDAIYLEPQPAGYHGFAEEEGRRVVRVVCYRKQNAEDNPYAHPIEGVIAVVDLNTGEVISVIEGDPLPIPTADAPYDLERIGGPRPGLKPLEIRQPEGGSFTLHGRELHWQKWRLHIGLHPREGLVLHQIGYEDGGRVRPVCYRASLAEMVVPYGDPSAGQFWRTFFDGGEAGLGRWTNSLALGCDCLGEITYLDAVFNDDHGNPVTVQNAICIHEEDFSVLWKHYDLFTKKTEVRRSRRLVVSFFTTIGNYDYGFYWYFYQGRIDRTGSENDRHRADDGGGGRRAAGDGHAAGPQPGRGEPPAPVLLPLGSGRRRDRQQRLRNGDRTASAGRGQSIRQRLSLAGAAAGARTGGAAGRGAAVGALLEGREPGPHERRRSRRWLRPLPGRDGAAHGPGAVDRLRARGLRASSVVGDPADRGGALSGG